MHKMLNIIWANRKLYDATEVLLISLIIAVIVSLGFIIAVSGHKANADPRKGTVYIGRNDSKVCDGTTLVYNSGVVLNSPQCN
jgi:hypothetical protein